MKNMLCEMIHWFFPYEEAAADKPIISIPLPIITKEQYSAGLTVFVSVHLALNESSHKRVETFTAIYLNFFIHARYYLAKESIEKFDPHSYICFPFYSNCWQWEHVAGAIIECIYLEIVNKFLITVRTKQIDINAVNSKEKTVDLKNFDTKFLKRCFSSAKVLFTLLFM